MSSAIDPSRRAHAIVLSGAATSQGLATALEQFPDAAIVAADSGLAAAVALGVSVTVVVGDFDSVDRDQLKAARRQGAAVERYSCEKDATDIELAVHTAVARGATSVCVVDSTRGRLDHFLATTSFLASPTLACIEITARIDDTHVVVVRAGRPQPVPAPVGATVSLVPAGGDAVGVTTNGLRYPLVAETLPAGTTRGVSNIVDEPVASVGLASGTLLLIVPDARTEREAVR